MKLKLVLLIDVLADIKAGAERQVYELIKGIDKERFSVRLSILHQKEIPQEIKAVGCEVSALGIKRIYSPQGIWQGFKFADRLKKEKTDILMTYHFGSDIWGAVFGRIGKVKTIISNRRDEGFWRKNIHSAAYKFINRLVRKIIAVSNATREKVIRQEGLSPEKVEVIYNGIDIERFKVDYNCSIIKNSLGLPLDSKVIGCVSNLRPVKGHKYLIQAARSVIQKFPEAHFLFVGDGELKNELTAEAKKLNIENNIHFLGQRNDIPELLSVMDVCVLPSLSEGLSNTLLEYMAAGKPIIATKVGGNSELLKAPLQGILVEPANAIQLTQAILKLLENPKEAENLAVEARKFVQQSFRLEMMIRNYENLFQTLSWQRKRILHLISSNGLFGAEKVMIDISSNLNFNGIKVWIIAIRNTYNPHTEVVDAAKNKNILAESIESERPFDLKSVRRLYEFIKQNNIDILHTHNYKSNFIGLLAAKRAKIPIVATLHGYIRKGTKLRLYEAIDRFILRYFDKIVLVDDSLRKWFKNDSARYSIINNGVRVSELASERVSELRKIEITIGVVGRLSEEKGHKYLLEAFSKILKYYPNAKLLIVGDGELKARLEELSASLCIKEKTEFAGFQEDVSKYYKLMDIYVSPSLLEHFPLSILEAMSFGKAIIATDVGGVGDLIKDGVTGILIKPASSQEIYDSLLRLIKDASLRQALGINARQFVKENYSLEKMVSSYKKVYEEVSV